MRTKSHLLKVLAAGAAAVIATACGQKNDGELISVNFNRVSQAPAMNISELAGEPEFIALDSRVEAFGTGYTYAFSDHYICIGASMRGPAKLYDRATGKFLRDVGAIGRGPGEYLNTYGSPRIDEEDGTVWLLPWQTKTLLGFNIATGKFKKEVPLKYGVPKGQFQVDSKAGTVTVAALPFRDMVPVIAWQQDMQGNVLWEIPAGHLTMTPEFSNEIESSGNVEEIFDLSLITWGGGQDSLYVINKGAVNPVYTIDFHTKEVESEDYNLNVNEDAPIHSYIMLPGHFITSVSYPVQTEWGFSTGKPEYVITDRRTRESIRTTFYNDYLAKETDYVSFTGGYWYTVLDPETFIEVAENALKEGNLSEENKARIQEILDGLPPESNNILMLAPIKK